MYSEYILRIDAEKEKYSILNVLLGIEPTSINSYWELSIKESSKFYNCAINYFLDLLEKNKKELKDNGITSEDISIWYLYEYEGQCNMEFYPNDLKRLGENEITFCISCWEKDNKVVFQS
jgi:hypothetical protein